MQWFGEHVADEWDKQIKQDPLLANPTEWPRKPFLMDQMKLTIGRRARLYATGLFIALLACLPARHTLRAEGSPDLPDVLKRCQAALARLKYVEYTVDGTPTEIIDHPRIQMIWREEGKKLIYHYKQWQDNGTLNFQADYSYNGLRSFNDWYNSGIYEMNVTPRPFDDWLKNLMFITVPFNFLLQTEGVPAWQQPNIKLLQDQRTWERLSKDAAVLGRQIYAGHDCTVIRVNHCRTAWQSLDAHYVVYFDLKSAMPVAWQVYNEHDQLIEDDTVTSEQTVTIREQETYVAPKQIRANFYSYDSGKQTRDMTWRYDFGHIVTEEPPDATFELDLRGARQIHDQVAHVYIRLQGQ